MPENTTNRRLDQPRLGRTRFEIDPDWFARFSERIARFLGTGRFLAIQTVIVVVWIVLNLTVLALLTVAAIIGAVPTEASPLPRLVPVEARPR